MITVHHYHDLSGEQKNQLLILCDKVGSQLGTATRQVCHAGDGKIHVAFVAFLFDKEGKVILTRRSDKKSLWAKYWDATVVSHVLTGETPEMAAMRRGKEEVGIETKFRNLGAFYYFAKHGTSCENEYCYVLVGKMIKPIYPNPIEIAEMKNISIKDLIIDVEKSPESYTPWLLLSLKKFKLSQFL